MDSLPLWHRYPGEPRSAGGSRRRVPRSRTFVVCPMAVTEGSGSRTVTMAGRYEAPASLLLVRTGFRDAAARQSPVKQGLPGARHRVYNMLSLVPLRAIVRPHPGRVLKRHPRPLGLRGASLTPTK